MAFRIFAHYMQDLQPIWPMIMKTWSADTGIAGRKNTLPTQGFQAALKMVKLEDPDAVDTSKRIGLRISSRCPLSPLKCPICPWNKTLGSQIDITI